MKQGDYFSDEERLKALEGRVRWLQFGLLVMALLLVSVVVSGVLVFFFVIGGPPNSNTVVQVELLALRITEQELVISEKSRLVEEEIRRLEQSRVETSSKLSEEMLQLRTQLLQQQQRTAAVGPHITLQRPRYSPPVDDEESYLYSEEEALIAETGSGGGGLVYIDTNAKKNYEQPGYNVDYYDSYIDLEYDDVIEGSGSYYDDTEENCPKFPRPVCPDGCVKDTLDGRGCPVPVCC